MSIEERLAERLVRWDQLREQGENISVEALCADCPELAEELRQRIQVIRDAEKRLGLRFPSGYREYVTRFGEGVLGGSLVRVYPPYRILNGVNNVDEWRKRIDEYWFWDDGAETLTKERALGCVIVGDTLNGDELIVHPSDPERIYVLPRDSGEIHVAGDGLLDALDWLCTSGVVAEPFDERDFEPFDSRG